jgi:hypothetical protein
MLNQYINIMSHNFGFIITRHVKSAITNNYWNQSIKLIRTYYPYKQIIIIDDNSNKLYVKAEFDYKNIIIIQSEYPGRGELLPYIYFLKYRWFNNAVILHDSVFIHKRIPFEKLSVPVLPLWHHKYDKDNLQNLTRIASVLNNSSYLMQQLTNTRVLGINADQIILCFGCQSFINLQFLDLIERKYRITNLINVIHNRTDRCSLERLFGALFCLEYPKLLNNKSLFGEIHNFPKAFCYHYENYIQDLHNNKIVPGAFVKVWSGR